MKNVNYPPLFRGRCAKSKALFVALVLTCTGAVGQTKIVSLTGKQIPMKDAMNEIEKQTGYLFVYDSSVLELNRKISVDMKKARIEQVLTELLKGSHLKYVIENRNIMLMGKDTDLAVSATGQDGILINGKIVDSKGQPVVGVSIAEQGKPNAQRSDDTGHYRIKASPNAILVFSYLGYKTIYRPIDGKNKIDVTFDSDVKDLEEVVVVGYGTVKKENLTGSVATVKSAVLADRVTASAATLLQGVTPGVTVLQSSSSPGGGASIKIREASTWQTSNVDPLIVIDGIQKSTRDFALLNPADIDNISVLKDAASSAIYGIKAGNGVILVTTKNGVAGKPRISYGAAFSTRKPTMFPEYMNAYDLASIVNETYRVKGYDSSNPAWYTDDELDYFKTHSYQNEWKDAVWMNNPTDQVHNLSVGGGSGDYRYYVSGSYLKQNGATNNHYDKYTMLAKMEGKVFEGLDFSLNMNAAWDKKDRPYWAYGNEDNLRGLIARAMGSAGPFRPPFINGLPTGNMDNTNMASLARGDGGTVLADGNTFNPTFELRYKFPTITGLTAKARGSYYMENTHDRTLALAPYIYYFKTKGEHNHIIGDEFDYKIIDAAQTAGAGSSQRLVTKYGRRNFFQLNGQLEYNRSFGLHQLSALAGYEYIRSKGDYMQTTVDGFPNLGNTEIDGSLGREDEKKRWVEGTRNNLWAQSSFISRVDYNYDQRYLLGVTFRADGSYKFPPKQRWGYFPSVSAAWNISRESFFETYADKINLLKLRASWGITGSDNTDPWQWQQNYNYASSSGMIFNGMVVPSTSLGGTINPNITWEKNRNIGAGIDLGLFNNLITLTVDYWTKRTTDILGKREASVPDEVGANLPAMNYGIVSANGWEFQLGHQQTIGDWHYRIAGNISFSNNKIVQMDQAAAIRDYENKLGKPVNGDFFGFVSEGIIRTQGDVDRILQEHGKDFTIFGVKPQPGMLMYKDLRGPAGVDSPDGKIDDYDKQFIGWNGIPRLNYGLSLGLDWKQFDLSAIIAGFGRYQGYARGNWFLPNGNYGNQTYWKDMWTIDNPNGKLPSGAWQGDVMGVNNVNQNSTFWLQNRSFARLKNVTLGYNFKVDKLKPVSALRVFVSGENLFEWVAGDWKRYSDPELGDGGAYPILRSFTAGVNVSF